MRWKGKSRQAKEKQWQRGAENSDAMERRVTEEHGRAMAKRRIDEQRSGKAKRSGVAEWLGEA